MLKRFMTYDEYETMDEVALDTIVPDDYVAPTEEEIYVLADKENGLMQILIALYNAPTKSYESFLKKLLINMVELFDTQKEAIKAQKKYAAEHTTKPNKDKNLLSFGMTKEQERRMLAVIEAMQFDPAEYFPTKEDIAYIMQDRFKQEKEIAVAYFAWLCIKDIELSNDEREIKEYVKSLLPLLVKEI